MTTSTLTLTDFLLARIAEDEASARLASEVPNSAQVMSALPSAIFDGLRPGFPARVLAECEAKRRIVHEYQAEASRGPAGERADFVARHGGILDAYRVAAHALALPYADHPDFNPDWRS